MGLLAAAIPTFDRHWGVNNALGDRFLVFRAKNSNEDAIGIKAQDLVGMEDQMRKELREAIHSFLDQFNAGRIKEAKITIDDNSKKMLRSLVSFCAEVGAMCSVTITPGKSSRLQNQKDQCGSLNS
jgi:hypothetical protein